MSTQGSSDRLQAIAVALALLCVLVLAFFAAPWYEEQGVTGRSYLRREGRPDLPRPQPESSPPSDPLVQDAVEDALAQGSPGLRVSVTEGMVLLTGDAPSTAACERARALASETRGVLGVECAATVPVLPQAVEWVREALAAEPALAGLDLQAEFQGGRTVLSGTVPTPGHRLLALEVAGRVRGIPLLEDRLQVPASTRPPAHTRGEVERRMRGDALLEAERVEVEMDDGVAILTGTVATAAEKQRAIRDASVPGVTRVEAGDLRVRPSARTLTRTPNDLDIRRDVHEALRSDPRTDKNLQIEVADGVVSLRGPVRTLGARRAAGRAAGNVTGVRRVANRLRVEPTRAADATRVEEALARNAWVGERRISASLRDGVVRLDGTVDDVFERVQAEEAVAAVEGVTAVENRLFVFDLRPAPTDPFVGDPTAEEVGGLALPVTVPALGDRDLLAAVVERLRWNAMLAGTPIQVAVDDGLVTLTGKVRGAAEARSAVATALRAGAVRVDDGLEF